MHVSPPPNWCDDHRTDSALFKSGGLNDPLGPEL